MVGEAEVVTVEDEGEEEETSDDDLQVTISFEIFGCKSIVLVLVLLL